jgi:hypothetical protein
MFHFCNEMGATGNPSPSHDYWGETIHTANARNAALNHMRWTNDSLSRLYSDLDQARTAIQNEAFRLEMENQWKILAVEWAIYEKQVSVAQARYVSNLYVNRIVAELRNLRSYVAS